MWLATSGPGQPLLLVDFLDTDRSPQDQARQQASRGVAELYQDYAVGLIRLAFVMLGDRGAAEDVVQDAFIGLYRNWGRLDDCPRHRVPRAPDGPASQAADRAC